MTSIPYTNAVAPASERRTLSIAFVVALHLAVIYTILVALNIVPAPSVPGPFTAHYIPATPLPPKPVDPVTVKLIDPTKYVNPVKPFIDHPVQKDDKDTTITVNKDVKPIGPTGIYNAATGVAGTHNTPSFPPLDRRLGHEGTVQLAITIDAQGNVTGANVDKSSGYDSLDAAAIAWVKEHWRYKPAMRDGAPVASTTEASVVFRLTQTGN